MEIPHDRLAPETLRAVIEEFVTREGTDYGEQIFTLDEKVAQVMARLRQRKAVITYDEKTETCVVVMRE